MTLIAKGNRDIYDKLTYGKEYETLQGIEPGIFKDRSYVTVMADDGKKFSCHLSRFEIKEQTDGMDK